jgi:nitrogen-specific signal transduction histidine kinase
MTFRLFRTELNKVCQQADLNFLTDEIPQALDQTLQGTTNVTRIVRAMKCCSLPGSECFQEVDLNWALESTLIVSRSECKYCADLKTEFSPNLPTIRCLPGELNQVFLNLIVNAAHTMQERQQVEKDTQGTLTVIHWEFVNQY